jgi:hypothetical protein
LIPVLIAACDFQSHESAASRFVPELAASFETSLQLSAQRFHRATADRTTFRRTRGALQMVAMILKTLDFLGCRRGHPLSPLGAPRGQVLHCLKHVRLWAANDLKPHRTRTFKLSNDPPFELKFWDVIGLYLDPPVRSVVCCDEKSQCQALERTQSGFPLKQGEICTRTHDYYRHGTITLFAALNYLNGKILAERAARHRHQEWLRFLKMIEAQTPTGVAIYVILDNYATHKHPNVKAWLKGHLFSTPV